MTFNSYIHSFSYLSLYLCPLLFCNPRHSTTTIANELFSLSNSLSPTPPLAGTPVRTNTNPTPTPLLFFLLATCPLDCLGSGLFLFLRLISSLGVGCYDAIPFSIKRKERKKLICIEEEETGSWELAASYAGDIVTDLILNKVNE